MGWTQVYHTAPDRVAAGDISGDGVDEIIGCGGAWGKGVWYRDVANGTWHHPWSGPPVGAMEGDDPLNDTPDGPIAAGDVTGDGKADMVSCWNSGLWYQDGDTLSWTKVSVSTAPYKVTCGDVTGDGQAEIISTWKSGIWYRDVAASKWTKMWHNVPSGDIAAGDFTGDGKADVASCWKSGLWYQDGASLGWTKVTSTAPYTVAAGNITGVSINLKKGIVAYYPFKGNANDESGNGNHGTVHGATLTEDRFGNLNNAYKFGDNNVHIVIPDDLIPLLTSITQSVWFKTMGNPYTGGGGLNRLIDRYPSDQTLLAVHSDNHKLSYWMNPDNPGWWEIVPIIDDTWYHAVLTYDEETFKLYLNGSLIDSRLCYLCNTDGTIYIGIRGNMVEEFGGVIDDIRIYNRALSEAEIKALYNLNY